MRKLKFHEKKLLRKTDFFTWKGERTLRENEIMRRYGITKREQYISCCVSLLFPHFSPSFQDNRLTGQVTQLVARLKKLQPHDPMRIRITEQLLNRLFNLGVIPTKKSLSTVEELSTAAFCRRRLPVVMIKLHMAETLKEATQMVEHGHVRVGPQVITDPAFLVTRSMEDFVTWVDGTIKRKIMKYHDKLDDFELLGN
jgi:U3 small nucleolar ribonucleoprotein protein IMP3